MEIFEVLCLYLKDHHSLISLVNTTPMKNPCASAVLEVKLSSYTVPIWQSSDSGLNEQEG